MGLTKNERIVWEEILEWEQQLYNYEPNDFEMTFDKWLSRSFSYLPDEWQREFFAKIDDWLFHLNGIILGTDVQTEARKRLLTEAKVFHEEIEHINDLQKLSIEQLNYLAERQLAKHRLYSFLQGGLSGTGGALQISIDIPMLAVINMRAIQLMALSYGYDLNSPYEMMNSLKVFYAATVPKRLKARAWEQLINDLNDEEFPFFYDGREELADLSFIEYLGRQIFKSIFISLFRKKSVQGIPLISMATGAILNYQFTRHTTDFAQKFYQWRYINAKIKAGEKGDWM
jgi:hypothetical protein